MSKKLDLQDKKSAFASAGNVAGTIVAAATSKGKFNGADINATADTVVDLQVAIYTARLAAIKELKLGGVEGKSSTGGGGGKSERSGGSKQNSGGFSGPGNPTDNQVSYYSDIADRIKADGGKLKPGLEKFQAMTYAAGKEALEAAIAIDPGK